MKLKTAILLGLFFFVLGVITLPHYGINWDTINHLPRGQAYLHYLLTRKKDFSDIPKFFSGWQKEGQWYWQDPDTLRIKTDISENELPARSLYQNDATTFEWFMEHDGDGHPPLSDILSSVFNRLLFGKLRLINDIDSYRIYGILLAAILVALVYYWASSVYGDFAGLISALSLSLYPLFWAESHFNTEKDIPQTAFWAFMLFSIWKAIKQKSWKWILVSGIFFGFSLGTKFNVLFSVFAIIPWLLAVLFYQYNRKRKSLKQFLKENLWIAWAGLFAILIGFAIFVGTWPYLWPDPIARIGGVLGFYKGIGLTEHPNDRFLGPLGVNTYVFQWIVYSTPPVVLFLFLIGAIAAILRLRREKELTSLLFTLWFVFPIVRASWPGTAIYGGVRQLMEYIPAMALLAGLGAVSLRDFLSKLFTNKSQPKIAISIVLLLAFVPIAIKLVGIHPNENVYFNSLIGGLAGAKEKNIPYWGFSFGSPYRQAASWINKNAEEGVNVVYTYDLIPNVPRIWLRRDLNLQNSNRSGYLRKGEYAMGLIYEGTSERSYYDSYLERFIEPVYEVKVDGVDILKVWKNDQAHLKVDDDEKLLEGVVFEKKPWGMRFNLGEIRKLSRLEIDYLEGYCKPFSSGYVQISKDGKEWQRLPGVLPDDWRISFLGEQPKDGKFIEPFVGQEARFIDLVVSPADTCLTKVKDFEIYAFDNYLESLD